jgi:hypothetical protein
MDHDEPLAGERVRDGDDGLGRIELGLLVAVVKPTRIGRCRPRRRWRSPSSCAVATLARSAAALRMAAMVSSYESPSWAVATKIDELRPRDGSALASSR